ncbi:hypothetical protein ACXZ65_04840 [Streptomyces aculeolatus]
MLTARRPPGPEFISALVAATWLDARHAVSVVWLLIGHPGPRHPRQTRSGIEAELLALAGAMGLAPAAEQMPDIGDRLHFDGRVVALDYGHRFYSLHLPRPRISWREHVTRGGPGCVALGLDPLPRGAGSEAVAPYLSRPGADTRVLFGAITARTRQQPTAPTALPLP